MPNKWIWLAIESLYNEEDILGAYASKDRAMQFLNEHNGTKLKWRKLDNGDFHAKSHGHDYYAKQCLFDDGE